MFITNASIFFFSKYILFNCNAFSTNENIPIITQCINTHSAVTTVATVDTFQRMIRYQKIICSGVERLFYEALNMIVYLFFCVNEYVLPKQVN